MRIGEIARRSGLRPSAIRFYEKVGLLPPALRQNGQRDFSPDTELCLATIALAREAGFSIAEIRTLFYGFGAGTSASKRWKRLARNKLRDLDLQFAKISTMRALLREALRCRCLDLKDCGRIVLRGKPAKNRSINQLRNRVRVKTML